MDSFHQNNTQGLRISEGVIFYYGAEGDDG